MALAATWGYDLRMISFYQLSAFALFCACGVATSVAVWVWRGRNRPGARWLALAMAAAAEWTFGAGMEALVVGQSAKVTWCSIYYLGYTAVTTLLFFFAIEYTHQDGWLRPPHRWWFAVGPALIATAVWTNPWHGMVWSSFTPGEPGSNALIYHHGAFYYAIIAYHYILIAATEIALLRAARQSTAAFRRQVLTVAVALLVALPFGWLYVLAPVTLGGIDITPVGFSVTGLTIMWALYRYRLFDLIPVAYGVIFQNVGEGMLVLDEHGRIVEMNAAAQRQLGLEHDVIGAPAAQALPGVLLDALQQHETTAQDVELPSGAGHSRFFELRRYPLRERQRNAGTVIALLDLTVRKEAEEALRSVNTTLEGRVAERTAALAKTTERLGEAVEGLRQREADLEASNASLAEAARQLKDLDRLKSGFLASVSHELRTPLANIKLYLSLLKDGKPAKSAHYLETLTQQADLLQELIEQMLRVSLMDAISAPPLLAPCEVCDVVAASIASHATLAANRRQSIESQIEPGLPPAIADAGELRQALGSLLLNAINFTPEGGKIVVRAEPCTDGEAGLMISVLDNGVGVTPDDIGLIFDRFYRGHAALDLGVPGVGLGLATSKELVARQGGRLTVDSQPGHGSTFTIWLPLQSGSPPMRTRGRPAMAPNLS